MTYIYRDTPSRAEHSTYLVHSSGKNNRRGIEAFRASCWYINEAVRCYNYRLESLTDTSASEGVELVPQLAVTHEAAVCVETRLVLVAEVGAFYALVDIWKY